jgi:hypothetical protein
MLNVHIPEDAFFTLFAKGDIRSKTTLPGEGTYIELQGAAALFYKFPHHRRAYIVREAAEAENFPAFNLPELAQKAAVVYRAKGRRIDILRNTLYNIEAEAGLASYSWETGFWQRIGCLIDSWNGHSSRAVKSNIALLCLRYRTIKEASLCLTRETGR